MTLFITNRNQELLWKIINKNEYIYNLDENFKINWFRQVVEYYYDKYSNKKLKNTDIKSINEEFIIHIKKDLIFMKEYNEKEKKEREKEIMNKDKFFDKISDKLEPKSSSFNDDYTQRQEEYNELLKKPLPKEVNFSEKNEEETIKDMDGLLLKQQEIRENLDKETSLLYEKYVNDNELLKNEDIETVEPK
tara:strand:+ start:5080 stop:5652 length:573 start_codon:yes stop_codon:yes gene_type:complete